MSIKLFFALALIAATTPGCVNHFDATAGGPGSVDSSEAVLANHVFVDPDANRQSIEKCDSNGGTWKIPAIGKKIYGAIQYGQNGCAKKEKVTLSSNADNSGGPCNPEPGYSDSGLDVALSGAGGLTFSGTDLTATVGSNLLQQSTFYTIFLVDQNQKTLFQQYVGAPVNGALSFSSPFEAAFKWSTDDELGVMVCYQ
jgi:hypothetical protein